MKAEEIAKRFKSLEEVLIQANEDAAVLTAGCHVYADNKAKSPRMTQDVWAGLGAATHHTAAALQEVLAAHDAAAECDPEVAVRFGGGK